MDFPLKGVRILDLSQFVAGPYCTMLLADAGAEVIKIEPLGNGEVTRGLEPFIKSESGGLVSAYFLRHNRNKKSIALNLKSEEGKRVFLDLVKVSDAVVENFKPGVMSRLGIGYDELRRENEKIIYVSISGYGHSDITESPYKDRLSFAVLAEAMGGVLSANPNPDGPPIWTGFGIGDLYPGALAVGGFLMALYRREKTGVGAHVDMAMYDTMLSLNERAIAIKSLTGNDIMPGRETLLAPFGLFKVKDGYLAIAVIGEKIWQRFCEAIGRSDLIANPDLQNGPLRAKNLESLLRPIIENWLQDKTRDEATKILQTHDVPAGPAQFAKDLFGCPQVVARNMLPEFEHPLLGKVRLAGNPIKMSEMPIREMVDCPPRLGEHTDAYLRDVLHYPDDQIAELSTRKAIGIVGDD